MISRTPPRITRLRVAFCIDNMNVGGTELNALRTAGHLIASGVDLRVFCLTVNGPLLQRYVELGIPVDPFPIGKLYGSRSFAAGRRMARLIRQNSIDVVHAHDFYSNIFAAPWARLAGAGFIASRRWWEGPERRGQRWANRASYVLAHRVLANSASVADMLVGEERVRRGSIVTIPNFLDDEAFESPPPGWRDEFARELGLPEERMVVGVVASLSPVKDHATLLRAIALLTPSWPTLHLVLAGADGGSLAPLRELAGMLGIAERVHFAGLRPSVPSAHRLFDVSALTSISEGLPNSILEAMASGRPVVATAVGAIPDAVSDGTTGFLVRPGDAEGVADRLQRLLRDPALGRRLGQEGLERARANYSAHAAIDRLLTTYRELARAE